MRVFLPGEGRDTTCNSKLAPSRSSSPRRSRRLTSLSVKALKERWRSLYDSEPHRRMRRELFTHVVAYRLHERTRGGLKPSTRRLLERIAASGHGTERAARD